MIINNEHYEKLLRRVEWLQSANSTLIKENAALRDALKHMSEILPQPKPTDKRVFASLTLDALSDASFEAKEGGAS